jgi:hypothetical protein
MAPEPSWPALDLFVASRPWHGVAIGPDVPRFGETPGPLLAKG